MSRLTRNVIWNYSGYVYETITGVFVVTYVVRSVAAPYYAVLLLSYSLAGLLYLLDLGLYNLLVQGYVLENSRTGPTGVGRLLSTAFMVLTALGTVGFLITAGFAALLPWPFHIPPEMVSEAVVVFLLAGATTQIALPLRAMESVFETFHRFDTLNLTQALLTTLRVGGTVVVIHEAYGIRGLAALQAGLTLARLLILWIFLGRCAEGVRLSPSLWDWKLLKPVWQAGGWSMLDTVGRQVAMSGDSLILSMFGSMTGVAIYGVGSKAPAQLSNLINRGVAAVFPSLASHHTSEDTRELRRLFVDTCRLAMALTLPLVLLGFVFSDALMQFCFGGRYQGAATVMRWLLLATITKAIAVPADCVLYARGRVATLSRISAIESAANLLLSFCLVIPFGGAGLAAATAITHTLGTVFWFAPAACRAVGMAPRALAWSLAEGSIVPIAALGLSAAAAHGITVGSAPFMRVLLASAIAAVYLATYVPAIVRSERAARA